MNFSLMVPSDKSSPNTTMLLFGSVSALSVTAFAGSMHAESTKMAVTIEQILFITLSPIIDFIT